MGLPEPNPEQDDTIESTPAPVRPSAQERPDWLVGAEEGAQSEYGRREEPSADVKLARPSLPEPPPFEPVRAMDPPALARPDAAVPGLPLAGRRAAAPPAPPKPVAWTGAGSSVPKLVQKTQPAAVPQDDPVESLFDAEPPAERALLGIEDEKAARLAPLPLDEPWWMVVGERLATDRRLQLAILSAVLVVGAAWTFWPRPNAGVSVHDIRRHAEEWEGRAVHVKGRVGEVFPIGQGVVFHLYQGRDTIVVFSRTRVPVPREKVSVDGTVSTGYLDGVARVAILENANP